MILIHVPYYLKSQYRIIFTLTKPFFLLNGCFIQDRIFLSLSFAPSLAKHSEHLEVKTGSKFFARKSVWFLDLDPLLLQVEFGEQISQAST